MKIAIFTDTYLPEKNGVVVSIKNFSEILAKRGHEILIIAPEYKGYKDEKHTRITVIRYPAVSFASNKATKVAFPKMADLMKNLRGFKPDVIHIQTPSTMGIVGIFAAKTLRIPNIQTYHTYLPELAVYFDVAKVFGLDRIPDAIDSSRLSKKFIESDFYDLLTRKQKPKTLSQLIGINKNQKKPNYKLTVKVLWTYTRWVYNRADLVLAPSQVLATLLKHHRISPPVLAQTNGIWKDTFSKKENYDFKNRIVYLGRLGFEKRIDVVIRAFDLAHKKLPKLKLDIYGPGPATGELKKLTESLGISDHVRFMGTYQLEDIKKKLKEYDAFVTASPMETQGLVILEAMSAGLPVIGVDALAVPEVVKNGYNGYVVPKSNHEKMAQKIIALAADDEKREKMGKAAIKTVEAHDMPKAVALLEEHYQSVTRS